MLLSKFILSKNSSKCLHKMQSLLSAAARHSSSTHFTRNPRVAIVGSGPAGLYVCGGLLRRLPTCEVDIIECNAVPYGLIRYGVAPDHPEVKNCINKFDRMFELNSERLSLYCNVCLGRDVTYDELCKDYDAVVLAYGARRQKRLQIPNIQSKNVFSGGDFVSWYNAVPNMKAPNLDSNRAVIIGVGNVALDCCRILLSANSDRIIKSDMPTDILEHLSKSRINHVTIIGRRGPLDVAFTIKELREQITLPDCSFSMQISDTDSKLISESFETLARPRKRLTDLMLKSNMKVTATHNKHCQLLFRRTPYEVIADENNSIKALKTRNTQTNEIETHECGLLIYSIGYENFVLDGIPKNEDGSMKMRDSIRVHRQRYDRTLVYASGWCAHQPRGVIANTQAESANVAAAISSDLTLEGVKEHLEGSVLERIKARNVRYRTWQQWKRIDEKEIKLGEKHGKPREKVMSFDINTKNADLSATIESDDNRRK